MVGGVVLNAVATALYIGSQLGRGPRDGLMTGLHRTTGRSLRLVRTGLEVAVVALGLLLGGVAGLGTVLYALAIGPLAQLVLPVGHRRAAGRRAGSGRPLTRPARVPPPRPARTRAAWPAATRPQRRVAISVEASEATITSTVVKRSSVSQRSRSVSTRP